MKSEDPFDEIGELLRAHRIGSRPPSGLEDRILRSLARRQRPSPIRWWPWLLLPPAAAMLWILFPTRLVPTVPADVAEVKPALREAPALLLFPSVDEMNPLQTETRALRNDAERAGRFLVDCLPSFDTAEN